MSMRTRAQGHKIGEHTKWSKGDVTTMESPGSAAVGVSSVVEIENHLKLPGRWWQKGAAPGEEPGGSTTREMRGQGQTVCYRVAGAAMETQLQGRHSQHRRCTSALSHRAATHREEVGREGVPRG
ncbi:unnamed protein product [Calypogeia fissa]